MVHVVNTAEPPVYTGLAPSWAALVGKVFWGVFQDFKSPWPVSTDICLGFNQKPVYGIATDHLYYWRRASCAVQKEGVRPQHPLQSPSSSKRETGAPAWSRQKMETLWFARGWCPGCRNWGNLPSPAGRLPPWRCFRAEVFAADGAGAGEKAAWGCTVHGGRFGSTSWQLVIRQAFKPPLPNVSKASVKLL